MFAAMGSAINEHGKALDAADYHCCHDCVLYLFPVLQIKREPGSFASVSTLLTDHHAADWLLISMVADCLIARIDVIYCMVLYLADE
jgi:hypothetical protein